MSTPTLPADYQHVFRSLPENFLLMAPDATIIDNTDSHVAVSLKPRAEVVGQTLFEAYPSVDENEGEVIFQSHEHVRNFLEPHTMPLIRYDLERPAEQGGGFEEYYWQATHYPILDATGQLQYILQRTQNVTEQLRAASAAREAQQKLTDEQERTRFILDSLPVLIWTATPDGQRDYFNPRWLAFTGKEMAAETGEQWLESLHPDDRESVSTKWQQAIATGSTYQVEYRLRRHDGQYRWVLSRALPRRGADGQILMWVGGVTDIHDQKLLVQEILETNEQQAVLSDQAYQNYKRAESQRETYQELFRQAPALICILRGPEHRYEFVNAAYQSLFAGRQLVGKTVAEALPEVAAQGVITLLDNVYTTGETFRANELPVQLRTAAAAGEPLHQRYFSFTYQRFSEADQPVGIMVFAFDITELVEARQTLERLQPSGGR
ncbi:PAS domain-containing protein [Hymenobacter sp. HMF4947]|uniref:histidine kinase n=1 Tax=Hymenobacter ginkgonis TaxID=2682976 RepID=A0A7K1TFD3_9BACT|nr:PAS domain-containing protein [Hymenobacter ginkgonis]MVN77123.1 PAS domain-containing protein [Hymenobacter ginkgonis]